MYVCLPNIQDGMVNKAIYCRNVVLRGFKSLFSNMIQLQPKDKLLVLILVKSLKAMV